jgi:tetratricopeptide (TPR) repeat protein
MRRPSALGLLIAPLCAALLLAIAVAPRQARAETVEQAYASALEAYYAGKFDVAIKGLERLSALPLSHEELFYNLGCAYFRKGDLGRAIFNFERALALDPSFDNARFNLQTARGRARSKVKDVLEGIAAEGWWRSLLRLLSLSGWWWLFIALWWLALGVLFGLRYIKPGPARAGLIATNALLAVLALLAGLLLAGRIHAGRGVHEGIVLPQKIAVREGPDGSARKTFKLHAGIKVQLKAESPGWARIRLPNGLEGWIPRRDLGVLPR